MQHTLTVTAGGPPPRLVRLDWAQSYFRGQMEMLREAIAEEALDAKVAAQGQREGAEDSLRQLQRERDAGVQGIMRWLKNRCARRVTECAHEQ